MTISRSPAAIALARPLSLIHVFLVQLLRAFNCRVGILVALVDLHPILDPFRDLPGCVFVKVVAFLQDVQHGRRDEARDTPECAPGTIPAAAPGARAWARPARPTLPPSR